MKYTWMIKDEVIFSHEMCIIHSLDIFPHPTVNGFGIHRNPAPVDRW